MSDDYTFSNGTEFEQWYEAWCATCVNDVNGDCELILAAYTGGRPKEWTRGPLWSPQTVIACHSYERLER